MPWMTPEDQTFARALTELNYANPFTPERVALERRALGEAFIDWQPVWSKRPGLEEQNPNAPALAARAEAALERLGPGGAKATDEEVRLHEGLLLYVLFYRFEPRFLETLQAERRLADSGPGKPAALDYYRDFRGQEAALHQAAGLPGWDEGEAAHLFACFYQLRRAFYYIYENLIGPAEPMARLRAELWRSIFSRDMLRYRRSLWRGMGRLPCLVTGPSGTGKELVARAVGLARYQPFLPDANRFAENHAAGFLALNLSALSPTLIESELFGHRKGAFTGATADRAGYLERCPEGGAVFLDEIGELEPALQVKLLRLLEAREFTRVGETQPRPFRGKVLAATHRDLPARIADGRFRADLYYRLCADQLSTPGLAEQLDAAPEALPLMARQALGDLVEPDEAEALAHEAADWMRETLGPDYPWPGNFRELQQCLRNWLLRGHYQPPRAQAPTNALRQLADDLTQARLSLEDLNTRYTSLVYARAGSYQQCARKLGVDHRTVKSRIQTEWVEAFQPEKT